MNEKKLDKSMIGMIGTHYVAAELYKRGYIALVTSRNTKGVDIICSNPNTGKTAFIQVKTTIGNKPHWPLSKKVEEESRENLFYVLVKGIETPEFHIVPSEVLRERIKKMHEEWLRTPGRKGQPHKDKPIRAFDDKENEFKDKWNFIEKFLNNNELC